MTGVHRKELRRHRDAAATPAPYQASVGSQVAALWLGRPGLQDAAGRPRPLPRAAAPGEPSFEQLVSAVTTDIRPRAVLDDWLDQGLLDTDADGRLVLRAEAFLPQPGRAEQMFFLGRNLHDHIAAAAANVAGPAPFLDRSVHYDGLSPEAAERLAALAREAAQRMLLDVNRAALAIAEADDAASGDAPRHARVNLGAYLFTADGAP